MIDSFIDIVSLEKSGFDWSVSDLDVSFIKGN